MILSYLSLPFIISIHGWHWDLSKRFFVALRLNGRHMAVNHPQGRCATVLRAEACGPQPQNHTSPNGSRDTSSTVA